jgi:hypothetical protein
MKKTMLFVVCILPLFSCVKTDLVNDRVDPKIFISNPLLSLENGKTHPFEVNYFNYVGKEIENPNVSWSSSDSSVLTITDEGVASGVNLGIATVTATFTTPEENLTIANSNSVTVSMSTVEDPVRFEGMIITTSNYELGGSFVPTSIADAYEIGPVTVFQGIHSYNLPSTISIYDYSYILYWCKPFGVKVPEGQIQ